MAVDNEDGLLIESVLLIVQSKLPLYFIGFIILLRLICNNPLTFIVIINEVKLIEKELIVESLLKLFIVVF